MEEQLKALLEKARTKISNSAWHIDIGLVEILDQALDILSLPEIKQSPLEGWKEKFKHFSWLQDSTQKISNSQIGWIEENIITPLQQAGNECEWCNGKGWYINEDHPKYPGKQQKLDCHHCQLQQAPLPVKECYQWVKASERLPDAFQEVFLQGCREDKGFLRREDKSHNKLITLFGRGLMNEVVAVSSWMLGHEELKQIEWLEQVTLPSQNLQGVRECYVAVSVLSDPPPIDEFIVVFASKFGKEGINGTQYIGLFSEYNKWNVETSDGVIKDYDNNADYWCITHWLKKVTLPATEDWEGLKEKFFKDNFEGFSLDVKTMHEVFNWLKNERV